MSKIKQSEIVHNYHILSPIVPCRFCHGDRLVLELWNKGEQYEVRCKVCGHRGPYGYLESLAVDYWNTANR